MSNNTPQKPTDFNNNASEQDKFQTLKRIQTLAIIASIAGPVSILFGGLLLNIVALIIGLVAFSRIRKFLENNPDDAKLAQPLRTTCIIALVGCSVAMVLNIVQVIMIYPIVVEAMNNGTLEDLLNGTGGSSQGSQTWG